jgi:hypothetical protein
MTHPPSWQLAQINVGKIAGININDPLMQSFVAQLDEVNSIAEASEGFVWRLKDEQNNATAFNPYGDDRIIINLSVWETLEALLAFVYKGRHAESLKNRKEWFVNFGQPTTACWYIPTGHHPSIEEAVERLAHLQQHGPTQYAFDFRKKFSTPQG